jgi:hypothetical protein
MQKLKSSVLKYQETLKPSLLPPNSKRSENSLNILIAPFKGSFIPYNLLCEDLA